MDEAALLQELKDVSNRRSERDKTTINRRLSLSLTCLSSEIDSKEGENEKDLSKNVFLNKTGENRELNQYWYSRFTIDKLCDAIRESLALRNGKKVAFLSTPSLFFSLKRNERRECALFDVCRDCNHITSLISMPSSHQTSNSILIIHSLTNHWDHLAGTAIFMTLTIQQTLTMAVADNSTWS